MTDKIDYEVIAALSCDIGKYINKIIDYIPEEKEHLLQHIATLGIHLALFTKNVYEDMKGIKEPPAENIIEFLEKCGCKEWMDKK